MADYNLTTRHSLFVSIGTSADVEITLSPRRIYDIHALTATNILYGSLDGSTVVANDNSAADKIKILPPVGGAQPPGSPLRITGVSTLKLKAVTNAVLVQITHVGSL